VTAGKIGTDAVTATEIAADAVGSAEIAADAVGSGEIATDAVGAAEIVAGAVGSSELAASSVVGGVGGTVQDNTIDANDLKDNSVSSTDILDATITGTDIASGTADRSISLLNPDTIAPAWTNMPNSAIATPTELFGSPLHRTKLDLTNVDEARITAYVNTAGSASAQLRIQYSTDQTTWNYLDAASGPATGVINTTGLKVSAWSSIVAGAKGDVFIRIVGTQGDAVADPAFGMIDLQVR
jgi:hypothetical protein